MNRSVSVANAFQDVEHRIQHAITSLRESTKLAITGASLNISVKIPMQGDQRIAYLATMGIQLADVDSITLSPITISEESNPNIDVALNQILNELERRVINAR